MKVYNTQYYNNPKSKFFTGNNKPTKNSLRKTSYEKCTSNELLHREFIRHNSSSLNIDFSKFNYNRPVSDTFISTAELEGIEIYNQQENFIKKYLFTPVYKMSKRIYTETPSNILIYSKDEDTLKNYTNKISLTGGNNLCKLQYGSSKNNLQALNLAIQNAKIKYEQSGSPSIIVIPEAYKFLIDKQFCNTLHSAMENENEFGAYFLFATEYPKEITEKLQSSNLKHVHFPKLSRDDVEQVLQHFNNKVLKNREMENENSATAENLDYETISKNLYNYKTRSYPDLSGLRKLINTAYKQFLQNPHKTLNENINENIDYYKNYGVIRNEN